jgi:hypothetical protein
MKNEKEDSTAICYKLEFPSSLSSVHFFKLTLNEGSKIISENFYWRGLVDDNYDNYLSLLPGKTKVITMKLIDEDTLGDNPAVEISGLNVSLN